ncbi:iron-sulfur cluster assembly scaffold protein [Desulfopila aestuarii]|uniref:Nitrogen fixation protein NifU n=1 Tax=Desulfopila aestuarii DSM 18488 TaxID=1121416 RepID=A0A1M7Y2U1_9BACT|nr:iron-sulfur cluster assembly scaffold protein [Desulfopila aestuarii]SHO46265.1 nitrogen fixation protein NifU [Desulfopila aestuarii DSM 18488]
MSLEGYSDRFVQMASNTERYGVLEKPDGYGTRTGDCGDKVEFYLSARAGQVRMLTFQISGCLNTFACANTVSYMVEGRSISDCWELSPEDVISFLQSLPPDHHHCAELVVGAFYLALNDYNMKLREPWRKDYPER